MSINSKVVAFSRGSWQGRSCKDERYFPKSLGTMNRVEAIASRLEAIAIRRFLLLLGWMPSLLEA